MAESVHDKLSRVRKPHVHISYEVFKDGATEVRELPFVVGVMGDFSGNPTKPLEKLDQRDFVEINRDKFNEIMAKMRPELNFKVDDTLSGGADKKEMAVKLNFKSMKDFEPAAIVAQVPPLAKLLELREQLKKMKVSADANSNTEELLEKMLDPQVQAQLRKSLGVEEPPTA